MLEEELEYLRDTADDARKTAENKGRREARRDHN